MCSASDLGGSSGEGEAGGWGSPVRGAGYEPVDALGVATR